MKLIGTYQTRQVFWFDYDQFQLDQLPQKDWLCLATSDIDPNDQKFEKFVRHSINNGILEFKGHGEFGEKLHDLFDEIMTQMEVIENHKPISVMTTWHNDETLADTFWDCFFVTCLPETADLGNISIICTDMKGNNRTYELKTILERFEKGWIPE
ncbi:MAG: hypothetical protein SF052_04270 [Bacteroidia bacterium]|nr:hypothetical protein [Bacteroidia bacterium]